MGKLKIDGVVITVIAIENESDTRYNVIAKYSITQGVYFDISRKNDANNPQYNGNAFEITRVINNNNNGKMSITNIGDPGTAWIWTNENITMTIEGNNDPIEGLEIDILDMDEEPIKNL